MGFDVIIIGSGFGGAITACRLVEAGMKVLILERGRRWELEAGPGVTAYPRHITDPWIWNQNHPELFNGWTDVRNFGMMTIVAGRAGAAVCIFRLDPECLAVAAAVAKINGC